MSGEAATVVEPSELSSSVSTGDFRPLSMAGMLGWGTGAAIAFHVAYEIFPPAILLFLFCTFQLSRTANRPRATYAGWLLGLCIYGPQLEFFFRVFDLAALGLWLVLATWLSIYLVLQRFALMKLGPYLGALAAPFIWTGVEYFRSELYYLRFSWLSVGYVMSPFPSAALIPWLGIYGIGFALMAFAATFPFVGGTRARAKWIWALLLGAFVVMGQIASRVDSSGRRNAKPMQVAGVQLEFPDPENVLKALDDLIRKSPKAELLVLSEYTFDGRVPSEIRNWCDENDKYLVAGGKDYLDPLETQFRNTAFVIGPDGREVFAQAKKVPIQFFKDGLPATTQNVWDSPWGKIGFCVCYDMSYTRVIDELIRQGAQAIIAPTMDVRDWGERQHRLHARVAPVRAAEYGIPIFRLCSSGISQAVSRDGDVYATAGFPGQGEMIAATLQVEVGKKCLPLDRFLVWPCVSLCGLLVAWHLIEPLRGQRESGSGVTQTAPDGV